MNSVRTSQETHYASATKPNRLMLFGETVAVYYENHTEHTNTLCGQNAEFKIIYKNSVPTSQETHYVSTTKPNRLMLFGETVAVYCENHTEHTDTPCGQNVEKFWRIELRWTRIYNVFILSIWLYVIVHLTFPSLRPILLLREGVL
jgi:hypothetical protein